MCTLLDIKFNFNSPNQVYNLRFINAGVCANYARDAGVGDCASAIPECEGRVLPPRRLVHGFRHWSNLYVPLLAFTGTYLNIYFIVILMSAHLLNTSI